MNARLKIVGCAPPPKFMKPAFVSVLGRIPKYSPSGVNQIGQHLGESHLLILPTTAECAAVALVEANAYGVPFLTTDVGGNASLVRQNYNAVLLSREASVDAWADAAAAILKDRASYERFAWQAYTFFRQQLSWEYAIGRFETQAATLIGSLYPMSFR
jgi:glycosyltransferase involved in cell wall biosynthesis